MRNAYRDELEAAQARADALERENEALRAKLSTPRTVTRVVPEVSATTLRVVSLFSATLGVMVVQLTAAGGVMLLAAALVLFLFSVEAR